MNEGTINAYNQHVDQDSSRLKAVKSWFSHLFGLGNRGSFKESVTELIAEHNASGSSSVTSEEKVMLHNVLSFRDTKVADIMIPRTDIIAVEQSISLEELKKVVLEHEHTRMPVYRGSLDQVIGFLHIKDLLSVLAKDSEFVMQDVIRELLVISPSMKNIDLLAKMRLSRVHMALVLDEYGGTDGLVTIEDLVEEIVGDIQDEHDDTAEPEYIRLDDHTIEASARLAIKKLERLLNMHIPDAHDEDFETLGGLLLSLVGYVPTKGEKISYLDSLVFEIMDSDLRKIKRILIHKVKNSVEE